MSEEPIHPPEENPYETPDAESPAVGVLGGFREDLWKVARYQRGIIFCILIQLGFLFGQALLPAEVQLLADIGLLAAGVAGAVYVFLLSFIGLAAGWYLFRIRRALEASRAHGADDQATLQRLASGIWRMSAGGSRRPAPRFTRVNPSVSGATIRRTGRRGRVPASMH